MMIYCWDLCLNGYAVENSLQTKLQRLPLGRRLWRCVAKGQKEKNTEPKPDMAYKVSITYSFRIQAAIDANVCYVNE